MRTPVLIILLIFFAWCFGSAYWYVCKIKGLCLPNEVVSESNNTLPENGNLMFSRGSAIPETNEATVGTFDSLKNLSLDTLLVEGIFYTGEDNQLAIERATNLKGLLQQSGFTKPISVIAKYSSAKTASKFRAVSFVPILSKSPDTEANADFSVEKKGGKLIIYFPIASADPHTNKELLSDLKALAESVKKSGGSLDIVGHTDNSGTHEVNLHYGQQRADAIKNILVELKVAPSKMTTKSQGESEPIASNETDAGKRKNRRVEIITIAN